MPESAAAVTTPLIEELPDDEELPDADELFTVPKNRQDLSENPGIAVPLLAGNPLSIERLQLRLLFRPGEWLGIDLRFPGIPLTLPPPPSDHGTADLGSAT